MGKQSLSIFDHALFLLSHREHAKKELERKLKMKGYDEEEISATILKLEEINYLNDDRFAEIFVRSRINKPLGENRIFQELIQKGVDKDTAKYAIENENADWFELALLLKTRRFGENLCTDFKEKGKQSRYLQYRGFNFDQIKYALSPQDEL